MEEQDKFNDRSEKRAGSDLDYEEKHSNPRPGESEYIPEEMDGIGPTGYRRSDEDVIHDVVQKLATQPGINASQIDASIQDGVVTLNGIVKDEDQKRRAEDAVLKVPGVVKVNNNLHTDLGLPGAGIHEHMTEADHPHEKEMMNRLWGNIRIGMSVVDVQGKSIGKVKEVRRQDFLLDRPLARDLFVPFDSIQEVEHQIKLKIPADRVGDQNWPSP